MNKAEKDDIRKYVKFPIGAKLVLIISILTICIATFRPQVVIDVATLTGAAVVGLGHH